MVVENEEETEMISTGKSNKEVCIILVSVSVE